MLRRLSKKDLAGGAQASCMLEARIDNSSFGSAMGFRGQPPTSSTSRDVRRSRLSLSACSQEKDPRSRLRLWRRHC